MQLNATGEIGNENTFANEAVVSGIYDQVSVSAGQFHYQTDGFRRNNHLTYHGIYDLFTQAAISPELNVQAEVQRLTSENGDLTFNFDPK